MTCDMTGLSDLRQDFEARAKACNALPGIIKFFTNSDAEAEDYTRYAGMLKQAEEKQAGRQDGVLSTLLLLREEFNLKKRDLGLSADAFDVTFGPRAAPGPSAEYDRYIKKIDCLVNTL